MTGNTFAYSGTPIASIQAGLAHAVSAPSNGDSQFAYQATATLIIDGVIYVDHPRPNNQPNAILEATCRLRGGDFGKDNFYQGRRKMDFRIDLSTFPMEAFDTAMVRSRPMTKIGIALSGGGATGDFQVGALRYLCDDLPGFRPAIIAGTSVGSINGIRIAEGDPHAIQVLERTWRELTDIHSMYSDNPAVPHVLSALRQCLETTVGSSIGLMTLGGPFGLLAVLGLMTGYVTGRIGDLLNQLKLVRGIYELTPIREKIDEAAPYWSTGGPGLRGKSIAVGKNSDGRLEVFARAFDDTLWHRWQLVPNATSETHWSPWTTMGQERITSDPVLLPLPDGSFSGLIARHEDNKIHERRRERLDLRNPVWGAWSPLGYPARYRISSAWEVLSHPTVYLDRTGSFAYPVVLARGSHHIPWINRWDWRPGAHRWVGWMPLADYDDNLAMSHPLAGQIVCALDANGHHFAFAKGKDRGLYFVPIGGPSVRLEGVSATSDPTVVENGGLLEVFVRGNDNAIYHNRQLQATEALPTAGPSDSWTGWKLFGGSISSNIAVGRHADGRLEVFARGNDCAIYNKWQLPNGEWDWPYGSLGHPPGVRLLSDPVVVNDADGRLELFAVGSDFSVWHLAQTTPAGDWWPEWKSLGGNLWTGAELRLTMVSLETGKLSLIGESGQWVGAPHQPLVNLPDAVIASSSIPVINPPVQLNGENFVDGGCRNITPIQAALEAGADRVYAIVASPPILDVLHPLIGANDLLSSVIGHVEPATPIATFDDAGLIDIGQRAIMDILPHSLEENELHPPQGWSKPVQIIRPSIPLHNPTTIEPGLVNMAIHYGYMRAYDEVTATELGLETDAYASSDAIISTRKALYDLEFEVMDALRNRRDPSQPPVRQRAETIPFAQQLGLSSNGTWAWPTDNAAFDRALVQTIRLIRQYKCELKNRIEDRRRKGYALPANPEDWWMNWEQPRAAEILHMETPWVEADIGSLHLESSAC